MITPIELFAFIAIAFAIHFLKIAARDMFNEKGKSNLEKYPSVEEVDSFVEIPIELMISDLDKEKKKNLDELKEKIKKFKERNRFYKI